MKLAACLALLSLTPMVVGATAAPTFVPLGQYEEGIVIPASSPVTFQHFDEYDSAQFSGQFVLEGVFVLDCDFCEPGYKETKSD